MIDSIVINKNALTVKCTNGDISNIIDFTPNDLRSLKTAIDKYFSESDVLEYLNNKINSEEIHPDILNDNDFIDEITDEFNNEYDPNREDDGRYYDPDYRPNLIRSIINELNPYENDAFIYDFDLRTNFKKLLSDACKELNTDDISDDISKTNAILVDLIECSTDNNDILNKDAIKCHLSDE